MKFHVRFCLSAVSAVFLFANIAMAETPSKPSWYAGVKVGKMLVDVDGLENGTNGGILLGYQFSKNISLEAEYTAAIAKGDADLVGLKGDWDVRTFAIFAALRSDGDLFVKGKAGYLNEDVSIDIPGVVSGQGSASGLSLGIGLGWRIVDSASLELEYTIVEQDIDFFSLGANFHF